MLFTSSIASTMLGATETFHRAGMGISEKDDVADVARTGFAALISADDHVVASSLRNKAISQDGSYTAGHNNG